MNKEEIEAIDILKSPLLKSDGYERHQKAIDTILNLIDKQEIQINECEKALIRERKFKNKIIVKQQKEIENSVSKDKIKDKIKELEEEKTKLNKEAGIDENIFTLPINLSKVSYIVYAIEILKDLLKGE